MWVIIEAIGLFAGSIILAIVYERTIKRIVDRVARIIYNGTGKLYSIVERKLLVLE